MDYRIAIQVLTGAGYAYVRDNNGASHRYYEALTFDSPVQARDWLLKSGWNEPNYQARYSKITYTLEDLGYI